MPSILIVTAHPQLERSRVTHRLMRAAEALARDEGLDLRVHDLYARYPDYLIDTAAEQALLRDVRLQVWLHPIHWYGMPPLMKLWLDEVYAHGWAYGLPAGGALAGQRLWLVCSTGGAADSYRVDGHNGHPFEAFLPPYVQTAALTGMRFEPPLVLHGAHRADEAALAAHAAAFVAGLRVPPGPPAGPGPACAALPADERPQR